MCGGLRTDDRGQAIQIGAVLLFAFLIIAAAFVQAVVVPQHNKEIEFNSYQQTSADMIDLRNALLAAAGRGAQVGTNVRTGAQYPARVFFVNPGQPAGQVRNGTARNVTVQNAVAVNAPDTDDYWDGTDRNFSTRDAVFSPAYNRLDVPPVVVTGQLAFRRIEGGGVPITEQTLVRNRRISLVTVTGDFGGGGLSTALTAEPVSVSTRTVQVRNASGASLVLTVPTSLPASTWETEVLDGATTVVDVRENATREAVDIELEDGVYELTLARVVLREESESTTFGDATAHYVVRAGGDNATITTDQTAELTAEVRDRFNNPNESAVVTFTTGDGTLSNGTTAGSTVNATTDEHGRATVSYDPSDSGTKTVTAEVDVDDDGDFDLARETTTFTVQVGARGESLEPVVLEGVSAPSDSELTFSLNNTDTDPTKVEGIQLGYVTSSRDVSGGPGPGSKELTDGADRIMEVRLGGGQRRIAATEGEDPVFFDTPLGTLPSKTPTDLTLEFNGRFKGTSSVGRPVLVRVTVHYSNGTHETYAIHLF